jgi:hypothetical protein
MQQNTRPPPVQLKDSLIFTIIATAQASAVPGTELARPKKQRQYKQQQLTS